MRVPAFLPFLVTLLSSGAAFGKALPITPEYEANCQVPVWSPDGARLSYEVNYHDRKVIELYVLTPGEGAPRGVRPVARGASAITAGFSAGGSEMVVHELSWAPASIGRFVYAASGADRDYDLYIDGASAIVRSAGADGGPRWSPDGAWIAFTSARTGQGDIYLLRTDAIEEPPRRLTADPESAELFIDWSPDSSRIAYVGHSDDGDNIYIIDSLDDPDPQMIINWGRTQTRPRFSPDGTRLAFYSNHQEKSRFDLYVVPLGGTPQLIAEGVVMNAAGPVWTPDGNHLLYVRDDEQLYDPVFAAPVAAPTRAARIPTHTVGNRDLDVTRGTDGRTYLALTAQGSDQDTQKDFKRVYVMELTDLP